MVTVQLETIASSQRIVRLFALADKTHTSKFTLPLFFRMNKTISDNYNPISYETVDNARYLLLSWCTVVLVGCLTGNTIILLATLCCKAIKLDRTSVVLIKNIAVSDILMGIIGVHPTLASLIHGTWPYGTVACHIFHFLQVFVYLSAVLLICGLHLSKLHTVLFPLHALGRTSHTGHVICAIIWLLCLVTPVAQLIVDYKGVFYEDRTYRCMYNYRDPVWNWLLPPIGALFTALPNILVCVTTAILVDIVKRTKGRINKQGIMVALYVGFLYVVANLPLSVFLFIHRNFSERMSSEVNRFFYFYLYRTAYFLVFMNCFCNFFAYFCSVKSFNTFVKKEFLNLLGKLRSKERVESFRIRLRTLNS